MRELIIDNFAGGGGASLGIEKATWRSPDIAINHDAVALGMHEANHPHTRHIISDVFEVDPREVTQGRPVGLAWFSPDCKHFSIAKGGKPVEKKIRGLAWVALKWAVQVRPRIICLENVREFMDWGPLLDCGRPCPDRKGQIFNLYVRRFRQAGYQVEYKVLRACDYGVPTIRKRLFVIMRCDGIPITWPKPTHGAPDDPDVIAGHKLPWRTAAECIDWTFPAPSIFERKRPLALNTHKRIARGIRRFVIETEKPFIVTCNHGGDWFRGQGLDKPMNTITAARDAHGLVVPHLNSYYGEGSGGLNRAAPMNEPLRTVTTENRHALVTPIVTKFQQNSIGQSPDEPFHTIMAGAARFGVVAPVIERQFGNSSGNAIDAPLGTVTAGGGGKAALVAPILSYGQQGGANRRIDQPHHTVTASTKDTNSLAAAFLAQHNTGVTGHPALKPLSTITGRGTQQNVVTAFLAKLYGTSQHGADILAPCPTVTATGTHIGLVQPFLMKYYGTSGNWQGCQDPLHTVPTRDRFGLVLPEIDVPPLTEDSRYGAWWVARFMEIYDEKSAPPPDIFPGIPAPRPAWIEIADGLIIVDIGMRMLQPRELFRAQGFDDSYIIDRQADGTPITKTNQIRMCGNSVPPGMAEAILKSNHANQAVMGMEAAQ